MQTKMGTISTIRFKKNEKETLKNLAAKSGMTVSDYIKYRLFDQNSDLTEEDIKYISPQSSKQEYFLAFSVMKIQRLLREVLLGRKDMTVDSYLQLDIAVAKRSRDLIAKLGYKKIKKDKDE